MAKLGKLLIKKSKPNRIIDRGIEVEPQSGGYVGLGAKPPAAGRDFVIFWKKAILMLLDHISLVFRTI